MNFDYPTDPRQALEASLTALLLGELPDDQARFLRQAIATDPELAKTFETLKKTIELVRETESGPVAGPAPQPAALKLSDERRQELFQRFKTVQPPQFARAGQRAISWLIPVAGYAAMVVVLLALLLPALSKTKSKSMASAQKLDETTFYRHLAPLPSTASIRSPADARENLSRFSELSHSDQRKGSSLQGQSSANETEQRQWDLDGKAGARNPAVASTLNPAEGSTQLDNYRNPVRVPQHLVEAALSSDGRPLSAASAEVQTRPPVQNTIVLPAQDKSVASGITVPGDLRESGLGNQPQWSAAAGRSLATVNSPNPDVSFSTFGIGGGALGGRGALKIPKPQLMLGDVPEIGRPFRSESIGADAMGILSSNGQAEFFSYNDSGRFVPQAQPSQNGVAAPASNESAAFRRRYLDEQVANAKKEPQSAASKLGETQQAAQALSLPSGTYYGGGAFGGYGTIQPLVPEPGQPRELIRIAGVGDVPVITPSLEKDTDQVALEKAPEKISLQAEIGPKTNAQSEQKLARLEVEELKEKAGKDTLNDRLAKAKVSVEDLKQQDSERSKRLGRTPLAGDRVEQDDMVVAKPALPPPVPQPEVQAAENRFSTFSLNVSDVSFKLAAASLEKGVLPEPESIRSEEFINAFDYRDPEPAPGLPVAFAWERASYPFAQNRDVLRFSIKTAAAGRQTGKPLNLVLLLDNSGSMERADRVLIIREALRVLAAQLQPQDTFSVVTFARTARLWIDGVAGNQAGRVADELSNLTPQGGTNLEEAMNLAYQTALRHYAPNGINRVVLLTDGAANLGDTNPEALKTKVESNRKQGIALDCFGIGWEGYNDDLLEVLTRHGDGRYGFLNTPEEAAADFAGQLAGALHVAASDVKVQVEFNPNRVTSYRQIGYARHQLTKEQFRDNTVDAAEIGAAESGNALYVIGSNPQGEGPLATVRVRYKIPGTAEYREHEWTVPFTGNATPLEQTSPAMRLAVATAAFSEWLASSPYATEVTPDRLRGFSNDLPGVYGADPRPQRLEWMIRQAKALSGK